MTIVFTIGNYARTTERGGIRFLYANVKDLMNNQVTPLMVGGVAYKVPTGKKFIVTEVFTKGTSTVPLTLEISGSTSTSAGGTPFMTTLINVDLPAIPVYAEISAGKYIVAKNTSGSSMSFSCYIYGIEVDA